MTERDPAHVEIAKPFWILHPDGRGFALEGNQAIELFTEVYSVEGFTVAENQPGYCEVPAELLPNAFPDHPKWWLTRQAKAQKDGLVIPEPLEGEKAAEFDERMKAIGDDAGKQAAALAAAEAGDDSNSEGAPDA